MIKIEFPSDNKPLAGAIGRALCEYSGTAKQDLHDSLDLREEDVNLDANTSHIEAKIPVSEGGTKIEDAFIKEKIKTIDQNNTAPATNAKVDPKGVAFDAAYCSEAKIPFYASGKTKDQWKKKKGVTEEDYSEWYASCLANVAPTGETKEDAPLDTSAAFGGQENQTAKVEVPKDCGAFMGWISGQQAANHLNQIDITDAYAKLGLQVTDLFPPNDAQTIAGHINKLFVELGGLE